MYSNGPHILGGLVLTEFRNEHGVAADCTIMHHDPDAVIMDELTATRESLHQLSEHVLAAARFRADGLIGLRVVPGGIATPPYGDDGRTVAVIGTEFIVSDSTGTHGQDISTLAEAATALGIEPGGPAQVYHLSTPCDVEAPLRLWHRAAANLAAWFNLADAALRQFADAHADDAPSTITLWPEHFDVGLAMAGCNYGASLGDAGRPEPYLYVGPHDAAKRVGTDPFWNEAYGTAVSWREVDDVVAAVAFFEAGRSCL